MANRKTRILLFLINFLFFLSLDHPALAHRRPPPGTTGIGDAVQRYQRMKWLETYQTLSGLRTKAISKLNRARLQGLGLSPSEQARILFSGPERAFPFSGVQPELRSIGKVKTLTILIDFEDFRAASLLPGLSADRIAQNIYGAGTADAQEFMPFESVRNYYSRASEGKLTIDGNVIGWINLPNKRASYQPVYPPNVDASTKRQLDNQALFDLVVAALDKAPSQTDYAQYDNDHDGDIDLLTILYAGPDTGWGSFWWAYRWEFFVNSSFAKKFSGKRIKQFVFQFVSTRKQGADFDPTTLVHETGHSLGLPDYYDYCAVAQFQVGDCGPDVTSPGPDGGVGGLDIMDGNVGNHNAFSRWLLDWVEPQVIGSGPPVTVKLAPGGGTPGGVKAVAIFPQLKDGIAPGQEMFIVENRRRVGNDTLLPEDGLLIWHIDGKPRTADDGFNYNNSYTDRKIIRLMRARSADDFAANEWADARDYFGFGKEFTPTSVPNSAGYDGKVTNIIIKDISLGGDGTVTATIGYADGPPMSAGPRIALAEETSRVFQRAMKASAPAVSIDLAAVDRLNSEFGLATPVELARLWESHKGLVDLNTSVTEASVVSELLLTHWAAKDGAGAVNALLSGVETEFVRRAFPRVMEAWASNDPKGANDWYFAAERAALRANANLRVGEQFAQILFKWRAASSPSDAASAIDLLTRPAEIYGAVAGLTASSRAAGARVETVEGQLKGLQLRSGESMALKNVQKALEDARGQGILTSGGRPADIFLQERLKDLGLTDR